MVNAEIKEMTRRFVETLKPVKIILFGSYAKDTYTKNSDYDFYIIMPDDTKENMIDSTIAAYVSIDDMTNRKAVDILTNKQKYFDERKNRITIERIINREGIVLYG